MKKIMLTALLCLSLLLCSCNAGAPTEPATDASDAYLTITRRDTPEFEKLYFGFENTESALTLSLPEDWKMEKTAGGFSFERNNTEVGRLTLGEADDADGWTVVTSQKSTTNGIEKQRLVEMKNGASEPVFRHRTRFQYNDGNERVVTLTCDYAELNDEAERKVAIGAGIDTLGNPLNMNMLSHVADGRIIILGNSFIASSDIGDILKDMLSVNGKALQTTAVSRGYAEVDTYIGDELLMNDIRNGAYDCVFICGFYADEEADHLAVLETACNESGTELVIFPAHNEFESCIKNAQNKCPDLKTLDWRGEINMIIESGVSQWDLCVNDTHKHSTPLAGYIGAQMIYRAIYGEIPAEALQYSIDQSYVESKLGSYVSTGKIPSDIDINYFD